MKGEGEKTCFQNMHIVKCGGVFGAGEGAGLPGPEQQRFGGLPGGCQPAGRHGACGPPGARHYLSRVHALVHAGLHVHRCAHPCTPSCSYNTTMP